MGETRKDGLTLGGEEAGLVRSYYVLGLDPGIASCGFCLLDMTRHRICEMGSHLFDAPQEPKTKVSLAAGRRNARSMRRNIKRTRDRLTHALDLMKDEGIVPADAEKAWFQPRKGERQVVQLRARGLDHLLTEREWAQVLYSLCVRRGYIPHGESVTKASGVASGAGDGKGALDAGADADTGKVLAAISANEARMRQHGWRTVGEMLAHDGGKSRNKGGSYELCVTNDQIVSEVHALFDAQRSAGSQHAAETFEAAYLEVLTWQKPTADYDARVYDLVGPCSYFPEEKRAADADVTSEMLRAQERLAHVRFIDADGKEQGIPFWTRQELMGILFSPVPLKNNKDCKVTYAAIRKQMDWTGRGSFKGIDAEDEKKKQPFEPRAWKVYRSCLPADLLNRMLEDRTLGDDIGEALTYASSEQSLRGRLAELDLGEEEVQALIGVPYSTKVFKGYGSRGRRAQEMLLGAFEAEGVETLFDAEDAVGLAAYRLSDTSERSELLPPYLSFDPTCRNPVVLRALSRMRRIVNAIIRIYGVPDEIHIELGRELKQSKAEKAKIEKSNKENEKRRKRLAEQAAAVLGCGPDEVKGSVIRKLELWEEQDNFDAYTHAPIEFERLVSDSTYCQIDHVLPYSRTCDDSRANKVLVLAKSNQDKKERSPYEWMTSGEPGAPSWEEFRARVQASKLSARKKAHLLETDLVSKQGEFIERNLNDDRYMSRAVKDYLEKTLAFPMDTDRKRHVFAVAGGAAANLRRSWHLNYGAGETKDRSDDRHHAVDAAVIAACSAGMVKRLAEASAQKHRVPKEERAALFEGVEPWDGFADDVRAAREVIVPTRMARHGVTGQAFEETLYRFKDTLNNGKANLRSMQKDKPSGNYVRFNTEGWVAENGVSARIMGGMAFLRLWFDSEARPKGKVKGQWYGEPVYYADIPALRAGTYIPRYMRANSARPVWPEVPETARMRHPLVVFRDDVVEINGRKGRFQGAGIATAAWTFADLTTGEEIQDWPTINKLGRDDNIRVVQEDVLGRCYYNLSER